MELIIFGVLLTLGYVAGTIAERRHYRSIEEREKKYVNLPAVTIKNAVHSDDEIFKSRLVSGNVVVSLDYFKRVLAGLKNIFGGQISSYETLVDRSRREAVLRMKKQAGKADIILNMRIETSTIGSTADNRKTIGSVESIAYGTAVFLKKAE